MTASMGDGLVTRVVACRRALDGVGSMAACGDIGDMVVLTVFGALNVPRSECCAAVCDPVVCESQKFTLDAL